MKVRLFIYLIMMMKIFNAAQPPKMDDITNSVVKNPLRRVYVKGKNFIEKEKRWFKAYDSSWCKYLKRRCYDNVDY